VKVHRTILGSVSIFLGPCKFAPLPRGDDRTKAVETSGAHDSESTLLSGKYANFAVLFEEWKSTPAG
jgi:hypothetical protein